MKASEKSLFHCYFSAVHKKESENPQITERLACFENFVAPRTHQDDKKTQEGMICTAS